MAQYLGRVSTMHVLNFVNFLHIEKFFRAHCNIVLTGSCLITALGSCPVRHCQRCTKIHIEHNVTARKMFVDIARPLKTRHWYAPQPWVRLTACDIRWNCAAFEKPDINEVTSPFGGINATIVTVELCTE